MKRITKLLSLFFAISFLTGCSGKKTTNYSDNLTTNDKNETVIRLQQQWTANSGFAGEIWAMYDTDSDYDLDLNVMEGGPDVLPIERVRTGNAEFGVAGAEQMIRACLNSDTTLVVIGVINYKSLTCFISKSDRNITTVKDLNGRTIGTMVGSPVDMVYEAIKAKYDIKPKKEVPTNWNLDGFRQDQYEVYPAFINDEPVTLEKDGIALNIIRPEYYGIDFMGTVYFCRKELADNRPDIVQKFIYAISEGWKNTIQDQKQAISYLEQYAKEKNAKIDVGKEEESLARGIDYYRGENNEILFASKKTWDDMALLMAEIKEIEKEEYNYDKMVDNRFVIDYKNYVTKIKKQKDND
jgi:NitT/TauT family transport system substrate-binding protein